ncbi:MAG: hypothetical protein IJ649_10715 [Oscillospiraceae bacterium]|nr:hypothetical protein [Oscillospiraceae bacterium]
MKKKDNAVLIEGFRKLSQCAAEIADMLESQDAPSKKPEEPAAVEQKQITKEDVRMILAEKSRSGYRAEVKALLTAHGADRLSEITDPEVLAAIAKEAEVIGGA